MIHSFLIWVAGLLPIMFTNRKLCECNRLGLKPLYRLKRRKPKNLRTTLQLQSQKRRTPLTPWRGKLKARKNKKPPLSVLSRVCHHFVVYQFLKTIVCLEELPKRDRENATVFVNYLPLTAKESDLDTLFRDVKKNFFLFIDCRTHGFTRSVAKSEKSSSAAMRRIPLLRLNS